MTHSNASSVSDFHRASLALIGIEPKFSAEAHLKLDSFEKLNRVRLPAAVREWFSLENAIPLLREYSFNDEVVLLDDWALADSNFRTTGNHDFNAQPILPISFENQGVCRWSVALYGSEDPLVFVEGDLHKPGLLIHAESFSKFVLHRIFEFSWHGKFDLCAQPSFWNENVETFLSSDWQDCAVTTSYPGNTNYLYRRGATQITIFAEGAASPGAEWHVASTSLADLFEDTSELVERGYFSWHDIWSSHPEVEKWLHAKKA